MGIINSGSRNSSYVKEEQATKFLMVVFSSFALRWAIGEALEPLRSSGNRKGSLEIKYLKVLFK